MPLGVDTDDTFEEVVVRGQSLRAKDQFGFLPTAASGLDQVERATPAWFRRIARGAFAQFIREFFDGEYKDRFQKLAPGTAVNFTTMSGTNLEEDKDKRFLQLARKMSQLWQRLPCILVTDTGESIIPPGLGYYDRAQKVEIPGEGKVAIRTRSRIAQVPLEIMVASRDEDSVDELADVIGIIIENRNVVGSILRGENWEVRLPTSWSPSARTTTAIGDDQTQTFGVVSISAEVGVEVWWYEKFPAEFTANANSCSRERTARVFRYKPKTALNAKYKIVLSHYPAGTVIYSKDPHVVVVDTNFNLTPVKLGTTSLIAKSPRDEVVDEFPIEICLTT